MVSLSGTSSRLEPLSTLLMLVMLTIPSCATMALVAALGASGRGMPRMLCSTQWTVCNVCVRDLPAQLEAEVRGELGTRRVVLKLLVNQCDQPM